MYTCVHVVTSVVSDSVTPWTVACQAPLLMEFSKQGVGCLALLQGIFPTQGSNPPLLQLLLAGVFFTTSAPPWKPKTNEVLKSISTPCDL